MKIYLDNSFINQIEFDINNYKSLESLEPKSFENDIKNLVEQDLDNIYSTAFLNGVKFYIRSPQQIAMLAKIISQDFTKHEDTLRLSLTELMMNSLEHGNLNIDSQTKNELIMAGTYYDLLYNLIESNKNKYIEFEYSLIPEKKITITDQGEGFNYKQFLKKHDMVENDNYSGRGIQIAKVELPKNNANFKYIEKGNTIEITFS